MNSKALWQLFVANLKIIYRNPQELFWIVVMPVGLYVILSLFHIERLISVGDTNYTSFMLPGLIALTVMQQGIYALAYWLVDLRSQGVIKRFQVTPISPIDLTFALLSARTIVAYAQVMVLTIVGVLFFNVTFSWNIISIVLMTTLGSFVFLLIGLLISTFAKSYGAAAPITAAIGLSQTFLAGAFYPVEGFPVFVQVISNLLPLSYFSHGLRELYLKPLNIETVWVDFLVLILWCLVLIPLVAWRLSKEE